MLFSTPMIWSENKTTHQSGGDGKQYDQRQNITFILCTQQQIDEYETQCEYHRCRTPATTLFFPGHSGKFESIPCWQGLGGNFFDSFNRLSEL